MFRVILSYCLLSFPFPAAFCQTLLGVPEIINFSKEEYASGNQNWKIRQNKDGLIYVANNDGLLCYDGNQWTLYPLPGKKQLRSIELNNGRIYIGGTNELGYFAHNKTGKFTYTSLIERIPEKERNFGAIWSIVVKGGEVFFRSSSTIFHLDKQGIHLFAGEEWRYMGLVGNAIYAQNSDKGIFEFEKEKGWSQISLRTNLPGGARISNILRWGNSLLIITQNHGFFTKTGQTVVPVQSIIINEIANSIVSAAISVGSKIAIATRAQGLFLLDENLNLVKHLTRNDGLHNNHIISLFSDSNANLWLGLDNGIDMLAFENPIQKIYPDRNDIGAGYAVAYHKGNLYLGTANYLYSAPIQLNQNSASLLAPFKKVEGSKGQVWNLTIIDDKLWMAHHNGAFVVSDTKANAIDNSTGYWEFAPANLKNQTDALIALNYKGVRSISTNKINDHKQEISLSGSKQFKISNNHFFALRLNDEILKGNIDSLKGGLVPLKLFNTKDQVAIISLTAINQLPVILTTRGILIYEPSSDTFISAMALNKIFGSKTPSFLTQDNRGLIWFVQDKTVGFISGYPQLPTLNYLPVLSNKMLPNFENLTRLPNGLAVLGSVSGFNLLDLASSTVNKKIPSPKILKVSLFAPHDSTLYEGNSNYESNFTLPVINPNFKALTFQFSAPYYPDQKNILYSYTLEGNDKDWSEFTRKYIKEYTNLPPRKYTFKVKSKYNGQVSKNFSSITFKVLPTWYQSKIFKMFLAIVVLILLGLLFRFQHKRAEILLKKQKAEQEQLRYLQQLEIDRNEKEIVKLRNEKLEDEINFKNSELASTAMHLVQKGEFIEKLKNELSHLIKLPPSEQIIKGLGKVIKTLGEAERIDAEWEIFAKHFDQIHKDFLDNLKLKFPNLTPNEIKLSAFIKIDLSTKEIAQLLNISVRGVEISRYRLRKKMGIPNRLTFHTFLLEHGL